MKEIYLETTDSTNDYAKEHFSEFPKGSLVCVVAEEQTKGKGRYARAWISPKEVNLYVTFAFSLPSETKDIGTMAQLMSVSLAHVLEQEGLKPKLKWPNDTLLNGKKMAGVLAETQFTPDLIAVFLGIGINVNMGQKDLNAIDRPATSLKEETKKNWNREELLKNLQQQFAKDLELFKKNGFQPFHPQFVQRMAYQGETVHCFDGSTEWVGTCDTIGKDGRLQLILSDGSLKKFSSGEVSTKRY